MGAVAVGALAACAQSTQASAGVTPKALGK